MARKYKANRIRGTRKSTYNIDTRLGGFEVPRRKAGMADKAYIKSFINSNRKILQKYLDKENEKAEKLESKLGVSIKKKADIEEMVYNNIKSYRTSAKKAIKQLVIKKYAEERIRFSDNLKEGLKTLGEYENFMNTIGGADKYNIDYLTYEGDGTYTYDDGEVKITIIFGDDSKNKGSITVDRY